MKTFLWVKDFFRKQIDTRLQVWFNISCFRVYFY